MLRPRIIPVLLIKNGSLVKTIKFKDPVHIGDPINAVRIFNDLEVDELIFLDIDASPLTKEPNYKLISELAEECFMPLAYGGGITTVDQIRRILASGIEKVVLNSCLATNPNLIREAADIFGSQSIVASMDVRRNWLNKSEVVTHGGKRKLNVDPIQWAKQLAELGAGEICVSAVDRDGTWIGYDLKLISEISSAIDIPVVAVGGAGELSHFKEAIYTGGASAAAAGSFFVYQKKDLGVLINYPSPKQIEMIIGAK